MISRDDFAAVMSYLSAGCGKMPTELMAEVYYDLLKDLPLDAVQFAAKRALIEERYAVFPLVGKLRELAVEAMAGQSVTPMEAWQMALRYIRGPVIDRPKLLKEMPEDVRLTGEALGWEDIGASTELDFIRGQFCRAFERIASREKRELLLPNSMRVLGSCPLLSLPGS